MNKREKIKNKVDEILDNTDIKVFSDDSDCHYLGYINLNALQIQIDCNLGDSFVCNYMLLGEEDSQEYITEEGIQYASYSKGVSGIGYYMDEENFDEVKKNMKRDLTNHICEFIVNNPQLLAFSSKTDLIWNDENKVIDRRARKHA